MQNSNSRKTALKAETWASQVRASQSQTLQTITGPQVGHLDMQGSEASVWWGL